MACIVCKGATAPAFEATDVNGKQFDFVNCPSCDTVQMAEVNQEVLAYAYGESYYGQGDDKFKWPYSWLFRKSKNLTAQRLAKGLDKENAKALDIGAGRGDFLDEMLGQGVKQVYGTEMNSPRGESKINWVEGLFPDVDLPESSFDLITMFHVFEHVEYPIETIEKLAKVAKPGGRVVISVPNGSSVQAKKYKQHWFHLDPPRHLHLIPPVKLTELMKDHGFEIVEENYRSFFYNPYGYLQSLFNSRGGDRDLLYESLKSGYKSKTLGTFLKVKWQLLQSGFLFPFYWLKDGKEAKAKESATVELIFQYKG